MPDNGFPKAETCSKQQKLIKISVVTDGLCFLPAAYYPSYK